MQKIILALILFTATLANAQNFNNASEYLDFVGGEQEEISKRMWKYTKAMAHSKSDRKIDSKRKQLIKSIERAISKIQRANGYDGDDYKNKVIKHLRLNESLLKNDYAKIVDMKAIAEQSYDAMEAYMLAQEMADQKMEEAQLQHESDLYEFANKHNINIVENQTDLSKKMKLSNEVFKHYNDMYLKYFKVYINEIHLWDAIKQGNVGSIQQNANALNQSAKEGLEILKSIEPYKNDASIINATQNAFEFFIDETENKIPELISFLILNEDFETIKTSLEKTPERKRTKEQINAYNKKAKELNKGVKKYNAINEELNTKRQKVINEINVTNQQFLANHIPND